MEKFVKIKVKEETYNKLDKLRLKFKLPNFDETIKQLIAYNLKNMCNDWLMEDAWNSEMEDFD